MNTVKIYRILVTEALQIKEKGIHFSLEPWSGNTLYYS
jgi:hypothetical protein